MGARLVQRLGPGPGRRPGVGGAGHAAVLDGTALARLGTSSFTSFKPAALLGHVLPVAVGSGHFQDLTQKGSEAWSPSLGKLTRRAPKPGSSRILSAMSHAQESPQTNETQERVRREQHRPC